ncbi:Uu.00g118690.m01.CDS01 [Anthostomella pinea]|uniref:Uu.00g118690.m01.CDS01 n=1 Tax=Anthostomella pinea TaxID=933095 RepID=A0AAI8VGH4_9PEZI|nr:Uu.00g118690.m01.CDS01 [Anthostomella pinea]
MYSPNETTSSPRKPPASDLAQALERNAGRPFTEGEIDDLITMIDSLNELIKRFASLLTQLERVLPPANASILCQHGAGLFQAKQGLYSLKVKLNDILDGEYGFPEYNRKERVQLRSRIQDFQQYVFTADAIIFSLENTVEELHDGEGANEQLLLELAQKARSFRSTPSTDE